MRCSRADVYYLAEKIGIHQLYALVVQLRGEPEPCEDAVSRKEAIREAKELFELGECHADEYSIIGMLNSLPSVQPEIVRCKDCIHHHYEKDEIPYCDRIDYGYGWKDNDFCSRAERREE